MSYDGGLSIKVVNGELLKILKAHLKQGTFDGSEAIQEWIGTKYAFCGGERPLVR